MGKRKREHREAVIEGREAPIRNTGGKRRWHFTLPRWNRSKKQQGVDKAVAEIMRRKK